MSALPRKCSYHVSGHMFGLASCQVTGHVSDHVSGHVHGQHTPQYKKTAKSIMQLWPWHGHSCNYGHSNSAALQEHRNSGYSSLCSVQVMQPALQL